MNKYYAIRNCYNYKFLNHSRKFSNLDPLKSALFSSRKDAERFLKRFSQSSNFELKITEVCMRPFAWP